MADYTYSTDTRREAGLTHARTEANATGETHADNQAYLTSVLDRACDSYAARVTEDFAQRVETALKADPTLVEAVAAAAKVPVDKPVTAEDIVAEALGVQP